MKRNNAEVLGYLAKQAGKNEGHCPYPVGSQERESWIKGHESNSPPGQMSGPKRKSVRA